MSCVVREPYADFHCTWKITAEVPDLVRLVPSLHDLADVPIRRSTVHFDAEHEGLQSIATDQHFNADPYDLSHKMRSSEL